LYLSTITTQLKYNQNAITMVDFGIDIDQVHCMYIPYT